jgi:polyhydroxyalkanoate synthesis regulator phasin
MNNTAVGSSALYGNIGSYNTAVGDSALKSNTVGQYNTALGYETLSANSNGSYMTAVGSYALTGNTTGGYDTAFGSYALNLNTTGTGNTAFGYAALRSTTTGNNNIGFGYQSLYLDSTGSNNIAMGYEAAYNVRTGSNDIEIGNLGSNDDNNTIRIGTQGTQTGTYIAGISTAQITGAAVYITSSGQLGVLASSERYKTAIAPMSTSTEKLQQLRPVSFHLKTDLAGAVQYGLIAEEVDKVYPELVIRDDTGKIQGVRYDELSPMLLNEMQQQQRINAAQTAEINHLKQEQELQAAAQSAQIRGLQQQVAKLNDLKQELHAAIRQLQSKGDFVAQR